MYIIKRESYFAVKKEFFVIFDKMEAWTPKTTSQNDWKHLSCENIEGS